MSGRNAPKLELSAPGLRVGIIAAQWHETVMNGLIAGAIRACEQAGASYELVRVPGAFELPLGAQLAALYWEVQPATWPALSIGKIIYRFL